MFQFYFKTIQKECLINFIKQFIIKKNKNISEMIYVHRIINVN